MTRIFKYLFILIVLLPGCGRAGLFPEREILARVGQANLYVDDLRPLFSTGMLPSDSIKLLESYVDMWVKKQLKIQEAEKVLGQSSDDIDKMVEEYRNSLLSYKFDQEYLENKVDTLVTENDIADYYSSHRGDYVLDRELVKGRLLRLPENHRQKTQFRELISASGEEGRQDLYELSLKNNLELIELDQWAEIPDFVKSLPTPKTGSYDDILRKQGVQELRDGSDIWLVYISARLSEGDANPMERVSDAIARIIYNQRRQEVIRNFEDSIYRTAVSNGTVEIKIDQVSE